LAEINRPLQTLFLTCIWKEAFALILVATGLKSPNKTGINLLIKPDKIIAKHEKPEHLSQISTQNTGKQQNNPETADSLLGILFWLLHW